MSDEVITLILLDVLQARTDIKSFQNFDFLASCVGLVFVVHNMKKQIGLCIKHSTIRKSGNHKVITSIWPSSEMIKIELITP